MAKRLELGRYTFNAEAGTITVPDRIFAERFLLITDVTLNLPLYNFLDTALGYTSVSYDDELETTTITLAVDTVALGCQNDDRLQIFIERMHETVEFTETFIDPVSKIRVSNPENLIDTDFEYGLQSSKWETLQTVNNVPTIYSTSGDVPLSDVSLVAVTVGSKQARVTTVSPHGLFLGDPINVQGVTLSLAEGYFLITGVADSRTFFYEMDQSSPTTAEINGSYTNIIPSKFFEGSSLILNEESGLPITTDNAAQSEITVSTLYTHGFLENTKMYLRNTVGPKNLVVTDPTATASDGRPVVDLAERINTSFTFDAAAGTSRGGRLELPIATYDWESTYRFYITGPEIDTANNYINWPGHGLSNRFCLLFNTPKRGQTNGGLTDGTVYYVNAVDINTIRLCTDYETLTSIVDLSTFDVTAGYPVLNLVYKVEGRGGQYRYTSYFNRNYQTANTNYLRQQSGTGFYDVNVLVASDSQVGSPSSCVINRIDWSGDLENANESIFLTIFGRNYNGLGASNVGININPNRSSGNFNPNSDVTRCLFKSGANWYITIRYDPTTFVGGTWAIRTYHAVTGYLLTRLTEYSGSDLNATWGLGATAPSRIIAFQQRQEGVGAFNTTDAYSNLVNQRTNARYSNTNPVYNYGSIDANADGYFRLNYNDGTYTSLGTAAEIFYAFITVDTAFRNTFYYPDHGLDEGDTVTLSITNQSASNRFSFADGSGAKVDINSSTLSANVSYLSPSLFRLQITETPFTDDVVDFPGEFVVTNSKPNPTYNSVFVANHKITSSSEAVYTTSGTVIGGLVDNTTYLLNRLNDSRFIVTTLSVDSGADAVTNVIGNNSAAPTNFNVNIETPLGISNPVTGSITKVEFRGDFGARNEFVTLTFEDGYVFDVGVQGQDSAVWQEDTTWTTKDISNVLKDIGGGNVGFTVTADPTFAAVDRSPLLGMNFTWEIRFTVSGESGTLLLSSQGVGGQEFLAQSLTGAYDGIYTITNVPASNQFALQTDFEITARDFDFSETSISQINNTVTVTQTHHNLITGERVEYINIDAATDLVNTTDYPNLYAVVVDSENVGLAGSHLDAVNGFKIQLVAGLGNHRIRAAQLQKAIEGVGTVSTGANLHAIVGNGTRFLTDFKRYDEFWIISDGLMRRFYVSRILTDTSLELTSSLPLAESDVTYYYITQVIPRPDGFSLHKPFDGGIDITAGTSPSCKIVRQTRKYFRYQSGKGIQNSFAINFSPTRIVNSIVALGTTITVNTQEVHNLQPDEVIKIYDAVITEGNNVYNGEHTITAVPTPFSFQFEATEAPAQTKAAGFPSYSRTNWRDSAIRAGMFDDQNGLFYEYDGDKLYAVRRSSTLQLSGTVTVITNSQVIQGIQTSFSTQLNSGDSIVVRGQTYKIVEVSSDSRIVVQPPYKGVNANRVKITKTIDFRIPQDEWNLDKCDGTGETGFNLDINKIQMAYADYSWYGAGKIRFGFKDQNGHVKYVHEFRHNNRLLESYFRSGNLPGRYEIENFGSPSTAPTLFHFGTSVIMDGTFDDDKAYLFSVGSKPFVFTNGSVSTFSSTGATTFQQITLNGQRVYVYAIPVSQATAEAQTVGNLIRDPNNTNIPEGTYIAQVKVNGASSIIYLSFPGNTTDPDNATINTNTTFTVGEVTPVDLAQPIPLISLRLAPSVDSGVTGAVGERDIINRMQLTLSKAGITTNRDCEAYIILNGLPSTLAFSKVQSPSLSEIVDHNSGDIIQQGTVIFSTKVSPGSLDIDLSALTDMGNSILGGDSIFPSGPDLITVAVQPQDTSTISGTNPLFVSGKITWTESQA